MQRWNGKAGLYAGVAFGALMAAGCEDPVVRVFDYAASSPIYSTPMLTEDAIIFGSENGEVVNLSKSGEFRWKYATRRDVVGAVKVSEGLVLFGSTNNQFYALDLAGREVWKYTTLGRIKGDPLVVGDAVIFGSYDKHVYALQTSNGGVRWKFPTDAADAAAAAPPPAAAPVDPKAAKPADKPAEKPADKAAPAAAAPAEPPPAPVLPQDSFSYSSPVLVGDNAVLGNLDGYVYALNAKTGALAWRFKTDGADQKKGVTSTVLETKDALVFGSNDTQVYAIAKDGSGLKWRFKTNDEVNATAIQDAEGNLYIGSVDMVFYSLDPAGKERWRYQVKGPVMGRAAIVDNLVVFAGGAGDGGIYALDRATGKLFWSVQTGGKIEADVVAEGNRIYVASGDRRMWSYQFNKTKE
jgi:outer membrane protein assembly factor BamB